MGKIPWTLNSQGTSDRGSNVHGRLVKEQYPSKKKERYPPNKRNMQYPKDYHVKDTFLSPSEERTKLQSKCRHREHKIILSLSEPNQSSGFCIGDTTT